ncbi:MAG: AAA family ATPase [Acidobacteria bacterium]|nr:AAA family ATPase [Acidobacteriota bacterium]
MLAPIIGSEAVDVLKTMEKGFRGPGTAPQEDLATVLSRKIIGQPAATRVIIPYVQMFQAGLSPEGRPAGVFLLLGPTGTGKTRTVEALAEMLHGDEKMMVKVDCGEFQMEHEVAKLIGAPPGYLGHRETQPILTQTRLNSVTSEKCGLSIVLFDEIEKAAPSMTRLLLGVLDKAILRLGDNTSVSFERSLVFLTSNLGAREMQKEINPDFGFQAAAAGPRTDLEPKLQHIGLAAVRRRFSPEFVNRIDCVVTYQPLSQASLEAILDQRIEALQEHINTRLGPRRFYLEVPEQARQWLLRLGTSSEYGARELNRTLHRRLVQPLAALVAGGRIEPGARVRVELDAEGQDLRIGIAEPPAAAEPATPTVLVVDDTHEMVHFLERLLLRAGWRLLPAESARTAHNLISSQRPAAALLDYHLPDGTGVYLAVELRRAYPRLPVVIMAGLDLSPEDRQTCEKYDFTVLRKPFLAAEVLERIRPALVV